MVRPDKSDPGFLLDIVMAADDAVSFVAGMDQAAFVASKLHQLAVIRCIEVVGEAAGRLSPGCRASIATVPWQSVIGMRHKLIHDYDDVRLDVVWRVATVHLPALATALRPFLPPPP